MTPETEDTIAAIATAGGQGGVGIIRISGPEALQAARTIISDSSLTFKPRRATLCNFKSVASDQIMDHGLVIYFPGPHSYTGEDVLELNCHGSPLLLDTLLADILTENDVRLAEPGEFTRRAFSNNKIDLAQADAVAGLISARSRAALKAEARQLNGELSCLVSQLRETLIYCRSRLEATLDFDEHDQIGELPTGQLKSKLKQVLSEIENLIQEGQTGKLLSEGCYTAIVGKPNVGKSSLFNSLLAQQRAIVTTQPGTTRDILRDQLIVEGIPFLLHDTAGIRNATDQVETIGVERSEKAIHEADLVIFLLDQSRPLNEEDDYIKKLATNKNYLTVINKTDLDLNFNEKDLEKRYGIDPDCKICANTGKGLNKLKRLMLDRVKTTDIQVESPLVTKQRHINQLEIASRAIDNALEGLEKNRDTVLIAEDLREASEATARITGTITTDDILDEIFSNFCIGK